MHKACEERFRNHASKVMCLGVTGVQEGRHSVEAGLGEHWNTRRRRSVRRERGRGIGRGAAQRAAAHLAARRGAGSLSFGSGVQVQHAAQVGSVLHF